MNRRAHTISFTDNPLKYSSQIESETYNDVINSLKSSVIRSINRSREITERMEDISTAVTAESRILDSTYREIIRKRKTEFYGNDTDVVTAFDAPTTKENVNISKLSGAVTLGWPKSLKMDKIPRYTDINGTRRPSKDVLISFGKTGSEVTMAYTNSIYNILDNNMDTFWIENVNPGEEYTLQIDFPSSIKPRMNYFELIPFPAYSFKVKRVLLYKSNGINEDITEACGYGVGGRALTAGTIESHIKSTSWGNRITLTLEPQYNVMGISNLNLGLIDYTQSVANIKYKMDKFSASERTSPPSFNYVKVHQMDFGLSDYSESDSSFNTREDLKMYAVVGATEVRIYDDDNWYPITKNTEDDFYVRLKFNKHLNQTPVFKYIAVKQKS